MNAISTPPPAAGGPSAADRALDVSCRVPLFVLFFHAAVWLVAASALSIVASLKFHAPDLFAKCAWLSYGRLQPAATHSLIYGFVVQAGLGVALWILVNLSRRPLAQGWIIAMGAKLWNLGVFVGLIGIVIGDSTGVQQLEMPRYSAVILLAGYLVVAIGCLLTFVDRGERRLEPPQWFLLTALLWFPWIFITARSLFRVRGVMQAVVNWWYVANLNLVWFGLVGLAVLFYLLPRFVQRPLFSRHLALFTFWTLILFASWSGIPASAPVPAWLPSISTVATVLTGVTVLSVMVNVCRTVGRGCGQGEHPPAGTFIAFGAMAFAISWFMNIAGALPGVSDVTHLTWFGVAQFAFNAYGFMAITLLGAIYYIVPRVTGMEWPFAKWVRAHFWLAVLGIVLSAGPLMIAGIRQGIQLNNPAVKFTEISRGYLTFLRVATTGDLLILLGHLLLLANLAVLSIRYYRTHFVPVYDAAVAELKPAEVKP